MNVQHQNSNIILNSKQKKRISLTKLSHRERERRDILEHRLHHDLWTTKQHHDLSTNAKKKSLQRREYQLPLRERERESKQNQKKFPLIPNCKTPNTNLLQFHTFAVASKQSIGHAAAASHKISKGRKQALDINARAAAAPATAIAQAVAVAAIVHSLFRWV
jgi:hypothetical protein